MPQEAEGSEGQLLRPFLGQLSPLQCSLVADVGRHGCAHLRAIQVTDARKDCTSQNSQHEIRVDYLEMRDLAK